MSDTKAAEEPIFRALLTPYRSLGRQGFIILMSILGFVWLATGLFFMSIGAWPVFGFFGLDFVAVYIAFRLNYRAARMCEEVTVSRASLDIRKVAPSGREEAHRFNPFWTRFRIARHEELGIVGMAVESAGHQVPIGSFLNPADRESFASAFGRALATAKAG
jgi:uncharacterized membrane protein